MQPTTDLPAGGNWTETLANLNILWILGIIAGLSLLRLAFVYFKSDVARSISEILESGMIAVALVFLIIRPFVLQAFFIPSPSMEPTLLGNNGSGDRILVNKFDYRLHGPHHDDVVVFLAPPAATVPDGLPADSEFIKRLIGLPGDRLQVFAGRLAINGVFHNHAEVRQKLAEAGVCGPEAQNGSGDLQADCHVRFVSEGVDVLDNFHHVTLVPKSQIAALFTGQKDIPVMVHPGYTVCNGQKLDEPFIAEDPDYDMTIFHGEPLKHEYGPYQEDYKWDGQQISPQEYAKEAKLPTEPLPAGEYMMMGDNRNDSNDSTNWGPLQSRRLVGRAQIIFWPPSRMGVIR